MTLLNEYFVTFLLDRVEVKVSIIVILMLSLVVLLIRNK